MAPWTVSSIPTRSIWRGDWIGPACWSKPTLTFSKHFCPEIAKPGRCPFAWVWNHSRRRYIFYTTAIYSRGWKFVYLVLKYTPFYSVLAGSVSLSPEKGVVICSHFSLLTQTPLPPLYLTLPLKITNYFTAMRQTVKQPFYGTKNEIYERLISKSSRIKLWRDRIVAINRICLSALFSIHFSFREHREQCHLHTPK